MPLPMPDMATKHETLIYRYVVKFHERLLHRANIAKPPTLKCAAWQLDDYLKEHGKYKDSDFIRTIITILEYYVQKKDESDWTLQHAKKSLSGRTKGVNQYHKKPKAVRRGAPVTEKLSKMLDHKLTIPRREFDDNS